MEKKLIALSAIITVCLAAVLSTVTFLTATAATNVTFSVNLTISGNNAPAISWVQSGLSANPLESSARTVNIYFNATDDNGYQDINYTSARIVLLLDGEPARVSTSCVNVRNTTLTMEFNCSVSLQYYDKDGSWTINASVADLSDSYDDDTSQTFSYGSLQAMTANKAGLAFGSLALSATAGASDNPFTLNNTGNQNFTQILVTAFDLVGQDTPEQYLDASDFFANTTDGKGIPLSNNSQVEVTGAMLPRDFGGSESNEDLYFYVTVPGAGLSNQNYLSSQNWIVEVAP